MEARYSEERVEEIVRAITNLDLEGISKIYTEIQDMGENLLIHIDLEEKMDINTLYCYRSKIIKIVKKQAESLGYSRSDWALVFYFRDELIDGDVGR